MGDGQTASRRRGAALVLLGAVLAAAVVAARPARSFAAADADVTGEGYPLVAAADGVRVTWTVPNFAVIDSPVDGGGPSAQARLDSLGASTAFASLPYPGDAFVGLPGLLAGFTGLPAAPAYPFYVHSSHPTVPDAAFASGPGMALSAHSDASASKAAASAGQDGGTTVARPASTAETIRAADGTLSATATSTVDGVVLGPLSIRGLVSTATVLRTTDGRQQVSSSLAAASVSVGGTTAALTDGGLVLAGAAAPVGTDPLADALAKAGVSVAFTRATATKDGVVAPSLAVTFTQYSAVIQRPVTIRYVFGATSASVMATAPLALPGPPAAGPGDSLVGPAAAAAASTAAVPSGPPDRPSNAAPAAIPWQSSPSPVPGVGATARPVSTAVTAGPAPDGAAQQAAAGRPAVRRSRLAVSESAHWAFGSLYLVMAAAGLVLAGGVELLRSSGVRKP
jgi:hypothetical protein